MQYLTSNFARALVIGAAVFMLFSCKPDDKKTTKLKATSQTTFEVPKEGGSYTFTYEIENPTATGGLTHRLQDGIDWVTDINTQTYGQVTFNVALSEVNIPRSATLDLYYEDQNVRLTVNQAEGEVIPHFVITPGDIDYASAAWEVSPRFEDMTYISMIVTAEEFAKFASVEEFVEYLPDVLAYNATQAGMTLDYYMDAYALKTGVAEFSASGLMPQTEYVVFALGMTNQAEVLSDFISTRFTTTALEMVDLTFTFDITPGALDVSYTITPSDNGAAYLYAITEGGEWTADALKESYQTYFNGLLEEVMQQFPSYPRSKLVSILAYKGVVTDTDNDLLPDETYTLFAMGVDTLTGLINTEVSFQTFMTSSEYGDWHTTLRENYTLDLSNATAEARCNGMYYNDVNAYNWELTIADPNGGDRIKIDLLTSNTLYEQGIASGTYKVATSRTDYAAERVIPGEYFYGRLSTWYTGDYDADGKPQSMAPAVGGTCTIVNNGDGTYSVEFAFLDDRTSKQSTFYGNWKGTITTSKRNDSVQ